MDAQIRVKLAFQYDTKNGLEITTVEKRLIEGGSKVFDMGLRSGEIARLVYRLCTAF